MTMLSRKYLKAAIAAIVAGASEKARITKNDWKLKGVLVVEIAQRIPVETNEVLVIGYKIAQRIPVKANASAL